MSLCSEKSLAPTFFDSRATHFLSFLCSKNNRSFDTPVKGPPQGPRLHIDIPRVQLLIEDKEGIKQLGEWPVLGMLPQRPQPTEVNACPMAVPGI